MFGNDARTGCARRRSLGLGSVSDEAEFVAVQVRDREFASSVGRVEERLDHGDLVLQLDPQSVGVVNGEFDRARVPSASMTARLPHLPDLNAHRSDGRGAKRLNLEPEDCGVPLDGATKVGDVGPNVVEGVSTVQSCRRPLKIS